MRGGLEVIASGETLSGATRFASGVGRHGDWARFQRTMTTTIPAAALKTFATSDFRLRSGIVMPAVTIAYRTLGGLAPARDNAVLVTHGNTSGPQMIDPGGSTGEGSWNETRRSRQGRRYQPLLRHLPEHAGLVLRIDQCGEHRSQDRQALWPAISRYHGERYRRHAARAARSSRHRKTGRDRRSVLWRLPGASNGRSTIPTRCGDRRHRHRAGRAARTVRGQCGAPARNAVEGSELERRRLLRSAAACWRA